MSGLYLLTPGDIRRELTRLNLVAAAEHHPNPDGQCPICCRRGPGCATWGGAVRALRAQGWRISVMPPHPARRPQWDCEPCRAAWPCGQARVMLGDRYGTDRPGLRAHMERLAGQAAAELGVQVDDLHTRFVAWTTPYDGVTG